MECTFPELLTREDMLRILQNQRQLKFTESELSDEELLKMFKTFAVPLARREKRVNKQRSPQQQIPTIVAMDVDDSMESETPLKLAYLDILLENKTINSNEKRHFNYEDDDSLSSATKRIKITWS